MDRKFWPAQPEPGFSVARNRFVIENTIKKYEKQRAKKMSEFTDKLKERTDAVASYLIGPGGAQRSRPIEQYFGKNNLAYLRGEDIRNKLIQQRNMVLKSPEERWQEKVTQQKLLKAAASGKGYKIKRKKLNGQKSKKRQKGI